MNNFKEQNGEIPVQLELGDTTSNTTEANVYVMEQMYPLLDQMGVKAVLPQDYELRDREPWFEKRMSLNPPSVLSNVYPKNPESEFGKLQQYYMFSLPGGIKCYVVNIHDVTRMESMKVISNHYDPIDPVEFLEKFTAQIGPGDILIATLNIKNERDSNKLKEVLESDPFQRVDLAIIPYSEKQFFTDQEQELVRLSAGWNGVLKQKSEKEEIDIKKLEEVNQGKPQESPASADDAGNAPPVSDGSSESVDESDKPTANQGGNIQRSDDSSGKPRIPGESAAEPPLNIINPGGGKTVDTGDATDIERKTQPASRSISEIDLKYDSRVYLPIENEYRAVPSPRSSEYIREIHFVRNKDGETVIEVSDILIDKRYPEIPEIKKIVDETDKEVTDIRQKDSIRRSIGYMERRVNDSAKNAYIGPEACAECHQQQYDIWSQSAHARALDSLKMKGEQNNDSCLKCHLTTWTKPDYYFKQWTFDKYAPELGCETCHGAGAAHKLLIEYVLEGNRSEYWDFVKSEKPDLYLRDLIVDAKTMCTECHDSANSPEFDFVTYWEKIEHQLSKEGDPLIKVLKENLIKERNRAAGTNQPVNIHDVHQ